MNPPDLSRVLETFIPVPDARDPQSWWPEYLDLLRTDVAALIFDLKTKQMLGWYSFLLHGRGSGVPTTPDDERVYVHLRLESLVPVDDLIRVLPAYCTMTRHMKPPDPPSLDHIQIAALQDCRVEHGWGILGESSEWVLNMLTAHDPSQPVPPQNVVQLMHYLFNQLQAQMLGFREPGA